MPKSRESLDLLKREFDYVIRHYESRISPLKEIGIEGNAIADFGCASGHETFALMFFFDARKVVGIDSDITRAENLFSEVTGAIEIINQELSEIENIKKIDIRDAPESVLESYRLSIEDIEWWENRFPGFLKEGQYPVFEEFTLGRKDDESSLDNDTYDISYCSSLLCHVAKCTGEDGALNAIYEMKRILKPGGLLAIYDPKDFSALIVKAKLGEVHKDGLHIVYQKPVN